MHGCHEPWRTVSDAAQAGICWFGVPATGIAEVAEIAKTAKRAIKKENFITKSSFVAAPRMGP